MAKPPFKRPTPKSQSFLKDYRKYGAGMGLSHFCRKFNYSPNSPKAWGRDVVGFREELQAINKLHDARHIVVPVGRPIPARHEHGMPKWQIDFLETWRSTRSRIKACDMAGKAWAGVRDAIKNDPVFKRCYVNLRKEILLEIEDSLLQQAMDGKVNAQTKVLETWDPQYAPKIKHDHNHQVYGQVAFKPGNDLQAAEDWKVIEGKVVEEEPRALPSG